MLRKLAVHIYKINEINREVKRTTTMLHANMLSVHAVIYEKL